MIYSLCSLKKLKNIILTLYKKTFFFVFRQINIINYFKLINLSKFKFHKFNVFTINFNSTSIKFFSINHIAKISQMSKHIALKHLFLHRFFHICRFCHETFTFNNALQRHLRNTNLISILNWSFEKRHSILHDHKMSIMIESIKFALFKSISIRSTFRF